jgi:hypothetical protein
MNVRRSVAFELAAVVAAVMLIVLSARRSTALWATGAPASDAPRRIRSAWLASGGFTAAALAMLAAIGAYFAGSGNTLFDGPTPFTSRLLNWHVLLAIALYFPWALIQQYIFQHYLLARLLQLVPLPLAIALTAAAFSSVHFPRWPVMVVVLIAGVVWSSIYARSRTLLPLACSHAVLGSALHYWVFGRDLLEAWLPF